MCVERRGAPRLALSTTALDSTTCGWVPGPWRALTPPPRSPPRRRSTGADANAADIACASQVSLCIATGIDDIDGNSDQGPNFVLVGTSGTWGAARSIPVPQTGDTDATIESVACSPTLCYGSGYFIDANGDTQGLIISTNGSDAWSETSVVGSDLLSLSCGGSGCTALRLPSCSACSDHGLDGSVRLLGGGQRPRCRGLLLVLSNRFLLRAGPGWRRL